MNRPVFIVSLSVATALLVWAFSIREKEGLPIFAIGSALFLCTLAVGSLRFGTRDAPTTNKHVIFGALISLILGGVVGAASGFGSVLITIFTPELMVQDFGASLGAMVGGILGAFILALLFGTLPLFAAGHRSAVRSENS